MKRAWLLLALLGCTGQGDDRTAIVVEIDAADVASAADTWWLILDPTTPFIERDGTELTEADDARLGDWVLDDEGLELRVEVPVSDDGMPDSIELQPGGSDPDFA